MRKINWPQAFAEVLILVVSVGLAVGADSWNDRRLERVEELAYLEALLRDFEQTRSNFQSATDANTAVRDGNLELLRLLESPRSSVPPEVLRQRTNVAFRLIPFAPVLGTYHDMVNSGKLELLRSDSLRLALAEFSVRNDVLQLFMNEMGRQWNDLQVPFLVSNGNVVEFQDGTYRGIDFPRGPVESRLDAYWSDEFANIVAISIISKQDIVIYAEELVEQANLILRLVEEALLAG